MLPRKIPKAPKRSSRWRSPAHLAEVRSRACCDCGSTTNVVAAHVRLGSHTGMGQKPDDWRAVGLCDGPHSNIDGQLGCHNRQHIIGEETYWTAYQKEKGFPVETLIELYCRASPKSAEIARIRKEREGG